MPKSAESWNIARYLVKDSPIGCNLVGYCQIFPNLVKYSQLSINFAESCKIFSARRAGSTLSMPNLAKSGRIFKVSTTHANLARPSQAVRIQQHLAKRTRTSPNPGVSCRILRNLSISCRILRNIAKYGRVAVNLASVPQGFQILINRVKTSTFISNLAIYSQIKSNPSKS